MSTFLRGLARFGDLLLGGPVPVARVDIATRLGGPVDYRRRLTGAHPTTELRRRLNST